VPIGAEVGVAQRKRDKLPRCMINTDNRPRSLYILLKYFTFNCILSYFFFFQCVNFP